MYISDKNYFLENNSKSDSDDDYSLDPEDGEDRDQTTRKRSTDPPEQESSPRLDGRGNS